MNINSPTQSIYLIAPSGAIQEKESCLNGINWLNANGYEVDNLSCLDRQFERFAGSDETRLSDIESIYKLTNHNTIVMSARGGYGANRLLPNIQWNELARSISQGIKLVGHSDFTAIELALFSKTQSISYAGPMLSYDFGFDNSKLPTISKVTFDYFQEVMVNRSLNLKINAKQTYISGDIKIDRHENCLLWGGNLSILVNLLGSSYFPSQDLINKGILFIEDVNEHPYRIERMLWQLLEAGVLSQQKAILLGDFSSYKLTDTDHGYDLGTAVQRINKELKARGADTVFIVGLPFGHIRDKATLPIGVPASLTANQNGFELKAMW